MGGSRAQEHGQAAERPHAPAETPEHGHPHEHGHSPAHGHSHSHAHHSHAPSADADRRWLTAALALILTFMVAEVVAGLLASSLALLSDAAHMLTDAGAIGLALVAARIALRPPARGFTFGFGRAEILSAQLNGAALLVLAGVIALEAIRRLLDPPDVEGAIVVVVGLLGAAVNVAAAWCLSRAERQSLNVAGARAHVLTDLYASLGAAAAGVVILATGFRAADGIAALVVATLMLVSGWRLLRDSARVLLEAAPAGTDPERIGRALAGRPGVREVHDLHVWEVTSGFPALAAHVIVRPGEDCHGVRRDLQSLLGERFGIQHVTLQVDHEPADGLVQIAGGEPSARSAGPA
jgi:cobalt-zinc-cadmium efflux system protein